MDELKKALESNGFKVAVVRDRNEAKKYLIEALSPFKTIGVGGSVTLREIGIVDALKKEGKKVLDHWEEGLSKEEVLEIRKKQLLSDAFLTSVNAVTMDGRLVSIDGIGNRVAAMVFGPEKVFIVVGKNKVVKDIHEAIERVRNIAAPKNAVRFGLSELPCAKVGKCVNCNHPMRICRVLVIMEKRPMLTDTTVVLVEENLGF